ncbi:MAG: discoidin domain-containing protein [Sphingobacteriales bacterium]|nr:MAG: discoidin domain-containing protein [Sphingobacteriales bacterium]
MLEQYGKLFDEAELAVQQEPILLAHVRAARLPVEFAALQQSRFYGIEQYGAFVQNEDGKWAIKPSIKSKLELFVQNAKAYGIKSLSENGYSPDQYAREWEQIFEAGPKDHLAINAVVSAVVPFSDEYPNKGIRTLTDGTRGYLDHQYNWLGWHGTDMEVILDLGTEKQISEVSTGFLEDQRHWAFLPVNVSYSFSVDGEKFTDVVVAEGEALYENYEKSVKEYKVELPSNFKTRYIRVHARNTAVLPKWRVYKGKKAWLFADEIMVR